MNKLFLNKKFDLQRFGLNVQTTLMDGESPYTNDLSPEMKTYYDKVLLKFAKPNLVHDQFAQKRNIPRNGGKTIEFRRYDRLPKALTPLTEGVTPDGQDLNVTTVTATVDQYGGYITLSDMLLLTAIDNNLQEAIELLGDQAGRTLDTITREVLVQGTNVLYAGGKSARTSLTGSDKLTVADIKKAVRELKVGLATKINGSYVAIVHPDVEFDLENDDEWTEASKYAGSTQIFEGEIGKLYGVRFVESTEAKIWAKAGAPITEGGTDKISVYATLVMGANAYGTTNVEGGGLESIVKQLGSGGTADPLNQRASAGWKAVKTAEILYDDYIVRIESASSYSTDSATAAN